jgi:hypothetical protein
MIRVMLGLCEQIVERLQLLGQLHWRQGAATVASLPKSFRPDESIKTNAGLALA